MSLRPGTVIELRLERIAERGHASGTFEDRRVEVAYGVPGDRVRARILGKKRRRFLARIEEVLEPSPLRDTPRCRYFGECGGCRWQNLIYPAQLDRKREAVIRAFEAENLSCEPGVPEVLPAEDTYEYRNKMEFSFGRRRWLTQSEIDSGEPLRRDFALGMFAPGRYDRVIDLKECHLQKPLAARVLGIVRELAIREGYEPWDIETHEGYLRHLVVRISSSGGGAMVNLVTSRFDRERMERIAAGIRDGAPEVTTLVNTVNSGKAQVATGETVYTVFGDGIIVDRIDDLEFEIAPHAFFQTNTRQAERLYRIALELMEPRPDDLVFDLFCGLGTITLFAARHVRLAVGLELDRAAVRAAWANAERNGIENVDFQIADLGRSLSLGGAAAMGRPDAVIADPPRAGMHKKALHWLLDVRPERVVYVSCNPRTQARDIRELARHYHLEKMQPIDLFPQTDHVENVALLRRRTP